MSNENVMLDPMMSNEVERNWQRNRDVYERYPNVLCRMCDQTLGEHTLYQHWICEQRADLATDQIIGLYGALKPALVEDLPTDE